MKSIDAVKQSDAKEWVIRMSEKGFAFQTISNFKRSLKAAFYTAIEDDSIRKNPFNFALDTVIEDDRERKAALTPKQEESLLAFMEQDTVYRKYRDEVIILLGTGLRISEFCGLTTALDFKKRQINVDRRVGQRRLADKIGRSPTPSLRTGLTRLRVSGSPLVIHISLNYGFSYGSRYISQVFFFALLS